MPKKGVNKEDHKMGNLIKNSGSTLSEFPSLFDDFFTKNWVDKSLEFKDSKTVPAVNIKETKDDFELQLVAPGFTKGDFVLELDNDELVISAERKEEKKEGEEGEYSRKEFVFNSFKRTFTLDRKLIDSEKISANYKDGILYVKVPKEEIAKVKPVRQIELS